jgi:hypothetical protein
MDNYGSERGATPGPFFDNLFCICTAGAASARLLRSVGGGLQIAVSGFARAASKNPPTL